MSEWGLTPEYIGRMWTEELLALMFLSRGRNVRRRSKVETEKPKQAHKMIPLGVMSDEDFSQAIKTTGV